MTNQTPPKIFVSYSDEDRQWLEEFKTHIQPYVHANLLATWDDQAIPVGSRRHAEISKAITDADIAVLLVTPTYLASDAIVNNELPLLLEGKHVFWIAVIASSYQVTPIGHYQPANNPSRPLSHFTKAKRSAEWVNIFTKFQENLIFPHPTTTVLEKPLNMPGTLPPDLTEHEDVQVQQPIEWTSEPNGQADKPTAPRPSAPHIERTESFKSDVDALWSDMNAINEEHCVFRKKEEWLDKTTLVLFVAMFPLYFLSNRFNSSSVFGHIIAVSESLTVGLYMVLLARNVQVNMEQAKKLNDKARDDFERFKIVSYNNLNPIEAERLNRWRKTYCERRWKSNYLKKTMVISWYNFNNTKLMISENRSSRANAQSIADNEHGTVLQQFADIVELFKWYE